mgnify:CR=1 FL=1
MASLRKSSLAIVGAGISGLTAARQCQKAGLAVTLYDKGRGVGGRCATRRRDDFAFDHGAQLIGATDAGFRGVVRKWMIATAAQRWKGRFQGLPDGLTPFVGAPGMNARGLWLKQWAAMNNMMITNTFFKKLPEKRYIPASQIEDVDPRFDKIVRRATHPSPMLRFGLLHLMSPATNPLLAQCRPSMLVVLSHSALAPLV